eukprot:scaffold100751_cov30-Tisochrysis_lutea.AAC.5
MPLHEGAPREERENREIGVGNKRKNGAPTLKCLRHVPLPPLPPRPPPLSRQEGSNGPRERRTMGRYRRGGKGHTPLSLLPSTDLIKNPV